MRKDASQLVLARFREKIVDVAVEVGRSLIHNQERGAAIAFGNNGALQYSLKHKRNEYPSKIPRGAFQEVLGGIDQDDGTVVQLGEEVNPRFFRCEEPRHSGVFED